MKKFLLITMMALVLVGGTAVSVFAQYKDGVFTAQDHPDRLKYVGNIKIEVRGGKIVSVEYNELKGKDDKRSSAYVNREMKKRNGITWSDAVDNLEKSLIKSQDPNKIDAITGASDSHRRFIALAKKALGK